MGMDYKFNRAWAEVNLDNIAHNVKEIRRIVDKKVEIMGVVKADAYGHGVMEIARTLLENGVTRLAVSMLDEAIQLRQNGIKVPILILSYTDPVRAEEIVLNDVTQTVFSHDLAEALSEAAVKHHRNVKIHIKIDTGMTRVGFMPGYSAVKNVVQISKLPGIIIEGLFTHFASADEADKSYTYMQFERFMSIVGELNRIGVYIPVKHVCNSAALIEFPEMHLNMVRPGIALYGLYPSDEVDKTKIDLRPAMSLKANVILVKDVEKDTFISYGRIFKTSRNSRIATIPIGYADGYTRLLTGKGKVLLNGQLAPIVGRICMDQCMVDITDIEGDVKVGDEAVLIGKQKDNEIKVEDLAKSVGTINYELVSIIGKRIPRVYLKEGKIYNVLNYLI
ncbi:alanine racemase [Acetivibrio thermocellus AD2]|jgi:alanine racemase|uniref:Alanine racemase n=3 Tax=Acetivibrio thermocellus TaxID=1515 RepID=A3DIW7_ACET2|nr:alanine racemase [Acetivibrio thermocellus ATCC 27405]ADU73379.1 alanine racemase [Acetivibrio thermocellus DSM 1313]ALX07301.1 Alanine racemase [Acetivibrio thermocellus AD2]ANV75039.1 Alanine racemase [Acetivibrio thermocellus DSM 2360]EIC04232.1 Alanine racemase [Acetivibrio thermocellus YS]CDG37163.1 Alanine racemase [Acetivibrio thermocellus BC1]SOD21344.1 alanine racemase [Acetivibrio thermocellus]